MSFKSNIGQKIFNIVMNSNTKKYCCKIKYVLNIILLNKMLNPTILFHSLLFVFPIENSPTYCILKIINFFQFYFACKIVKLNFFKYVEVLKAGNLLKKLGGY